MKRIRVLLLTVALVACDRAQNDAADAIQDVYDRPVPDPKDAEAVEAIAEALRPRDQNEWRNIMRLPHNTMLPPMTSATVGEAISRYWARVACTSTHGTRAIFAKLGEPPMDRTAGDYQTKRAAYDAAVKVELKAELACYKLPT